PWRNRRPVWKGPTRSRRHLAVATARPVSHAARAQVVQLTLHALLGHAGLLGAITGRQLFQHVGLPAGQHQACTLDVAVLAGVVDHAALLRDRRVQPLAEGEAVGQQRRVGDGGGGGGILGGVATQRVQPLLLLGQGAVALGDLTGDIVLALLLDPQQRVEPLRSRHRAGSWAWVVAWVADAPGTGSRVSSSRRASAARLASTSEASVTSWPRNSRIFGQRASASSTTGSLPRW